MNIFKNIWMNFDQMTGPFPSELNTPLGENGIYGCMFVIAVAICGMIFLLKTLK